MIEILQIIVGAVFVLFLPGFSLSYAFFPKKEIDMIERVAISFGLSIAVVPLVVFYLNRFAGMPINLASSAAVVVLIILVGAFVYFHRTGRFLKKKK